MKDEGETPAINVSDSQGMIIGDSGTIKMNITYHSSHSAPRLDLASLKGVGEPIAEQCRRRS